MSHMEKWFSINQFYTREARFLDELQFFDWLDLFSQDLRYWMPIVQNRIGKSVGQELTEPGQLAHFEDDKVSLTNRVKRLLSGRAWAETPPGRTNHLVSNVEIIGEEEGLVSTRSQFLIYRSHLETDQEFFSGTRFDKLLADDVTDWKVTDRTIIIDHAVLTQKSLGIFF